MIGFAFCHGWGFDATALRPLAACLRECFPDAAQCHADLGFNNHPRDLNLEVSRDWIAIGHSYGFAWLLQQNVDWAAAVALNGFTRFCRKPGQAEGTPVRLLDAMYERLSVDAVATVRDFRARCGEGDVGKVGDAGNVRDTSNAGDDKAANRDDRVTPVELDNPDVVLLAAHLRSLRDLDVALPRCPVLALAGADDVIVPAGLATACFGARDTAIPANVALRFLPGGHLLPLHAPRVVAAAIQRFVQELPATRPASVAGVTS